jgi:hypothetical protein
LRRIQGEILQTQVLGRGDDQSVLHSIIASVGEAHDELALYAESVTDRELAAPRLELDEA